MMTPSPLILTLDIGTSSMRAMLFDRDARPVPGIEARADTPVHTTPDGGVEIDAEALLRAFAGCLDTVLAQAGPLARQIAGVGSATLVGTLLGVDEEGKALTPIYTWADTRGSAAADELRQLLDEAAVYDRTGCRLHSAYAPALLRWLNETRPDVWRRVARWIGLGDYLHARLFGSPGVVIPPRRGAGCSIGGAWSGIASCSIC